MQPEADRSLYLDEAFTQPFTLGKVRELGSYRMIEKDGRLCVVTPGIPDFYKNTQNLGRIGEDPQYLAHAHSKDYHGKRLPELGLNPFEPLVRCISDRTAFKNVDLVIASKSLQYLLEFANDKGGATGHRFDIEVVHGVVFVHRWESDESRDYSGPIKIRFSHAYHVESCERTIIDAEPGSGRVALFLTISAESRSSCVSTRAQPKNELLHFRSRMRQGSSSSPHAGMRHRALHRKASWRSSGYAETTSRTTPSFTSKPAKKYAHCIGIFRKQYLLMPDTTVVVARYAEGGNFRTRPKRPKIPSVRGDCVPEVYNSMEVGMSRMASILRWIKVTADELGDVTICTGKDEHGMVIKAHVRDRWAVPELSDEAKAVITGGLGVDGGR